MTEKLAIAEDQVGRRCFNQLVIVIVVGDDALFVFSVPLLSSAFFFVRGREGWSVVQYERGISEVEVTVVLRSLGTESFSLFFASRAACFVYTIVHAT